MRAYLGTGIRRITLADAQRFSPDASDSFTLEPRSPRRMPLDTVQRTDDEITDALYGHLRAGRADKASGLVQLLFLAGRSVAQIVDGSFRLALERIGEDWNGHDAGSASWEQRAVQICIRILHELSAGTPALDRPLVAVGGAPSGDAYILPAMSAAAVLRSVGFDATNLGPQTSTATMVATIHDLEPALVWLSITAEIDDDELLHQVESVLEAAEAVGATLLVGGLQAHSFRPPSTQRLIVCDSMVELAAFAAGLIREA